MKVLYLNKEAKRDYEIIEKVEAGIVLKGWEVKSIKLQNVSLKGSFIKIEEEQAYLLNSTIGAYKFASDISKDDLTRKRKLLLKKRQITNLHSKVKEKGYTLFPLDIYVSESNLIKLTIALGKGRKKFDKRQKLKERDMKRQLDRDRKSYSF
ncbi:MAG: SsrA-binding protein SmpB [Candidatus Dojkabacteria bacterium]|nr:SsrA-binding protein SmpB [Candidatus Dojkabacteria bacterium]